MSYTMYKNFNEIVKEVAKNNNLSIAIVEEVVKNQFGYAKEVIESEVEESVKLKYIGTLKLSAKRISKTKKK